MPDVEPAQGGKAWERLQTAVSHLDDALLARDAAVASALDAGVPAAEICSHTHLSAEDVRRIAERWNALDGTESGQQG